MQIYVIIAGEYSDKHTVGYFTNEEEAEKYCAIKNATDYERHYIDVLECLDNTVEGEVDIGAFYTYFAEKDGDNWSFRCIDKLEPCQRRKPSFREERTNKYSISVFAKDKEHADKVVKDCFYQMLAQQYNKELERLAGGLNIGD